MPTKVSNLSLSAQPEKAQTDKYELSPFEEALQQALKGYADPEKLGDESPLATEYFLSSALPKAGEATPLSRGELLCTVIRQAAESLWGAPLPRTYDAMKAALIEERKQRGSSRYGYLILELRYFQKFLRPRTLRAIYESDEYLLDSKAGDHRSHKVAIQQLAQALLSRFHPSLRLEQPILAAPLIGYEAPLQQGCQALAAGHTVTLIGPSGAGKTTLGAAILQALAPRPAFWFTLRPTLNDRLGSLLFSLGHFLHEQGASNLWQFLAVKEGTIQDLQVALALVRQDLHQVAANPPLLCFDEFDRLHQLDPEQSDPHYTQLREFVESLQGSAPILLITQRPLFTADRTIALAGFHTDQLEQLAARVGIRLAPDEVMQLLHYTGGNPRMALLCLALHQSGEALTATLTTLPQRAGLLPLLHRLWSRLLLGERRLLQQLALFRGFTPEQYWEKAVVERLLSLRLLERDGRGGLALIPGLRETLYAELPTELRQELHLAAATLRAQFAEYTAAAYHYWQAALPAQAIQLWYPQRQAEIARGQAEAALLIFTNLSGRSLALPERKALDLVRAELRLLRGELRPGFAEVEQITWWDKSTAAARAHALRGRLQEALGYPEAAFTSYTKGAEIAQTLIGETSTFLIMAGRLQLGQANVAKARRMARLAECNTQVLLGQIEDAEGWYDDALLSYQKALLTAQHLEDQPLIGMLHREMAVVYGRCKRLAEAVQHIQHALQIYEAIGDRPGQERVRSDLACIYIDNRQFQAVIEPAHKAYHFFKTIQSPLMLSVSAANLAEAYFELSDWQQAEHFAQEVIAQEEPYTYPFGLFTLGRLHGVRRNWEVAAAHFTEVVRIAGANEDRLMVAHGQRELGNVYQAIGRYADARNELQSACQLFEAMGIEADAKKAKATLQEVIRLCNHQGMYAA